MNAASKAVSPARVVRFIGESQIRYAIQPKPAFGKWMKNELTIMGPAFIKLGQFLSTRPDILGKDVTAELANLQDNIAILPFHDIKKVIETSLEQQIEDVFDDFSENALASASIGQVHTAILKKNKRKVAVKVQKPDVATLIKEDLATLKKLNDYLLRFQFGQAKEVDRVLTQYERFLSGELYYLKELEQMRRFKKLLENQSVLIPGVYASLSSDKVLTMEYVESIKISDVDKLKQEGIDTSLVARDLIALFVYQMINVGYIHSDPHPGNIGVIKNGNMVQIVLYDFGNVAEFTAEFRTSIAEITFAVYQRDINEFVDLLLRLNVIELDDADDVYEIKEFFSYFFKYLESLDISTLKSSLQSGELTGNFKDRLKINPDFLSLFRIFSLLDGTCSLLDTNFNYIEILGPFTEGMMQDATFLDTRARKDFEKLRDYPGIIQSTDGNVSRMKRKVEDVSARLQQTQFIAGICLILHDKLEIGYLLASLGAWYAWTVYKSKK